MKKFHFATLLCVFTSACAVPAAQQRLNFAREARKLQGESLAKSAQCQERKDYDCARYYLDIANLLEQRAQHAESSASVAQSSALGTLLMMGALNSMSQGQPQPAPRLRTTCIQNGPFLNCN